jgi:hypothetical protein
MNRNAVVAAISLIASVMVVPAHALAMPPDLDSAYTMCAQVDATVTRIARTPAGFVLTVYDMRLTRSREAMLTSSSTVEDRKGNYIKESTVHVGDRVSLVVPGRYTNALCTLRPAPRVAFAQDSSR